MAAPSDIARWIYTPKRLGGLLIVVVLLVVVVALLRDDDDDPSGADNAPPSSASSQPAPSPSSAAPSASPDKDDALDAATEFVAQWADEDEPGPWMTRLQPLVTEEFAQRLATTDPSRVPADDVKGDATLTDTASSRTTMAAVDTDAGLMSVSLTLDEGRWLVYDIQPGAQQEEG